jgi:phosphoserine phosphatase
MRKIKLICFDLDDTLITKNSSKNLNLSLGVTVEKDRELYDEHMSGKITYEEWNDKLFELYLEHGDATREGITRILSGYEYVDHAREVINNLKRKGYVLVLISGSIDILVSQVAHDLGIEYHKAHNSFVFNDSGRLVSVHADGSDTHAKLRYLEAFAEMLDISIDECACVGDGANDIEMFKKTGNGITFKGSKIEKESWKVIDSLKDLETIFAD